MPIPKNWQSFLSDEEYKTALLNSIAATLHSLNTFVAATYSTKQNIVLSNQSSDFSLISPCVQEEAGTCMLLHVSNYNGTSVDGSTMGDVRARKSKLNLLDFANRTMTFAMHLYL